MLALAGAAGCGSKKDPPPPPVPAQPVELAPDDSACKLVTKEDAAKLLGHPVGDGAIGKKRDPAECVYKSDSPAGSSVSVMVYSDGQEGLRRTLKAELLGKDPVQLPGIGQRAYRTADGTRFGMLAKGKFVFVSALSADSTGPSAASAEGLVGVLANRL